MNEELRDADRLVTRDVMIVLLLVACLLLGFYAGALYEDSQKSWMLVIDTEDPSKPPYAEVISGLEREPCVNLQVVLQRTQQNLSAISSQSFFSARCVPRESRR